MSWTTGTQTEALAVGNANGTALATSTTNTAIEPFGAAGYTPANFWLPSYGSSKALHIFAKGVLGTTGTPNLTLAIYANTAQATLSSNVMATTGVVAQASSVTNVPWELDCLITCASTGSSGTFLAYGVVKVYTAATTIQSIRLSSSSANPNTAATLSTQLAYYWELAALWGTSSASNTITCYSYEVLGLN
jgi:hypothetical protein